MDQKNLQNLPSLWGMWIPSNTPMPGPTPLIIPNGSSIASRTCIHLHDKLSTGYNGVPHIHPPKCPFHEVISTHLLASSLDPADLPSQMASRSNQPFFPQYTRQTDTHTDTQMLPILSVSLCVWPTDRIGNITCTNTNLRSIDYSDSANNTKVIKQYFWIMNYKDEVQLHLTQTVIATISHLR